MSQQWSCIMSSSSVVGVVVLLLQVFITCVASSECSYPISHCNDITSYSYMAEYALSQSFGQSVCLTSNSSNHTILSNTTAAIYFQSTSSVIQYCSGDGISLDPVFACSSNESTMYEGVHVLFVSFEELANENGRVSIDITANDANGNDVGQFNLNYASMGIYPVSDSPISVHADNNISLQWISYEAPLFNTLSFTDLDDVVSTKILTDQYTWTPPCVEPSDNFPIKPAVPVLASYSINQTSVQLSGSYTVTSSNGFSSSIALKVKRNGLPVLSEVDNYVSHRQIGSSADILCSVEYSNDRPSWYFNNVPISNNDQYTIGRKSLEIANVSLDSGGWYTCAASNEYGSVFKDFLLIPVDKPTIIIGSALPPGVSYTIASGSSLVLPCTATGLPPPTITWYKDDEQVVADNDGVVIDEVSGALIISNYTDDQRPTNGYICNARNTVGSINSSLINVNITDTNASTSSYINEVYNVGVEETILLKCPMYNNTNSTNKWYKNGVDLVNPVTSLHVTNETVVVFGESDGSSGGVYCCQVNTGQLVHDTRCYVMNMQIPATLSASNLVYTSTQSGRNISFFIATESISYVNKSSLVWYRNGSIINKSATRFSVHQDAQTLGTLSILNSQPSDKGSYSVRVSSSKNVLDISFEVVVVDTSCDNNLLSSSNGEGSSVTSDWSGLGDSSDTTTFLSSSATETHFTLSPNESKPQPSISQTVQLSTDGFKLCKAKFSCRMRSSAPQLMLPQVMVNIESTNSTILLVNLSNSTQEAWQWVTMETSSFSVSSNSMEKFIVSMVVDQVNGSSFDGSVYFDDLCFSITSKNIDPTTSTPTPTTSPDTATPTSTPTDSTSIIDEILEYRLYIIIVGGCIVILIVLCCSVCCIYCCCCRKKKQNQKKAPLLKELAQSLENRNNIELTPAEKQATLPGVPVYIEPGPNGTAIYLEHSHPRAISPSNNTSHSRLLSESYDYPSQFISSKGGGGGPPRNRVSSTGPYDYPSLSKSVGSGTSPLLPDESYDSAAAHSPGLRHAAGSHQRLSRESSPLPSTPTIITTPTITTTNEVFNRSPRGSSSDIHISVGAVRKLSDIFEKKKVEPTLSDEENPYDTCELPEDQASSPWSKGLLPSQKQQSDFSMLTHHQLATSPKKAYPTNDHLQDDNDDDNVYDVCVLDSPPPTDDPYSRISPSASRLPLPSLPEKGKDSNGYLVVVNKKDEGEENPYNTIESHYDNPKEGHTHARQSSSSITHSNDGYLLVIDKKEQVVDETYDDLEKTKTFLDNEHNYCNVNTTKIQIGTEENDTYVVPSLELSDKFDNQEENIYY